MGLKSIFGKAVVWLMVFALPTASAANRELGSILNRENVNSLSRGNIFVYGDPSMDQLIPVRVLGSVGNAGIHFVPEGTDLVTLISLAGGPSEKADLTGVTLKRANKVVLANLEELVTKATETDATFQVQANDIVLVPKDEPFISEEALRTAGFIAALATIFGTVALGLTHVRSK